MRSTVVLRRDRHRPLASTPGYAPLHRAAAIVTAALRISVVAVAVGLPLVFVPSSAALAAARRGCARVPGSGLGLTNVAAHGERLMTVGANGLVATSSDPARWEVRPTPVRHALRGVAWVDSRWVVVGDVGTVLFSLSGTRWTVVGGIPAVGLRGIAGRRGLLAAASGTAGTVISSTNGRVWTRRDSGTTAILWGGTTAGAHVLLSGQLATVIASADGISWRRVLTFPRPTDNQVAPRPFLWQLADGRGRLVAVGDFGAVLEGTLQAGLRAVRSPTDEILRGVTFGRGVAVAVGSSGTILRSTSRGRWVQVRSPTTVDLRGVAFTGSRFVAVGDESTVISSADGTRWHLEQTAMPCALLSVARGAGRFVAVGGSGRVLDSSDGRRWRAQARATREDLYGVGHGRFGFVAVGARGDVLQSRDGRRWVRRRVATHLNLRTVTWTGREYLIGGDRGLLFSSPTGARWSPVRFAAFHSLRAFATAAGVTVVAGAGTVGYRPPGGSFRFIAVGLGRFQTGVAAGAGRFVVVGHNGEALVSTDSGRSWAAGRTGVDINLDYVAHVHDRFIAVGEGVALTSRDGLAWRPLSLPTPRSIRSVVALGAVSVAVGDGGVVLRSTDGGSRWRRVLGPA